jgi:Stigma-specific protein, Stig1
MPKEDHSSTRSHQSPPQGGVELSLDELAKGLATGTLSRGKAIRWMGGALLGAALSSVPGVAWADDCRRLGRECRRDSQCCSRNCVRRGDDKVCGCPEGKTRCNDRCVNLDRNENHCGECFNRCEQGQECMNGVCGGGVCTPCGTQCCTAGETCYGPFLTNAEPVCCSNDPLCQGNPTAAGTIVCVNLQVVGGPCPRQTCNTDADCSGEICIQTPGCPGGGNRCVPAC